MPTSFADLNAILPLRPVGDRADLDNAIELVDRLAVLPHRTADQEDYLEVLSTLIEKYEAENDPIDTSDVTPLDALKSLAAAHDMSASDLGRLLGDRSLGPKLLSGARELSKQHIRTLSAHFKVDAGLFI